MNQNFIGEQISKLLVLNKKSEYNLSTAIEKSKSYINKITSGKSLPSMKAFLDICDYFNISPAEFFNEYQEPDPPLVRELTAEVRDFPEGDLRFMLNMAEKIHKSQN